MSFIPCKGPVLSFRLYGDPLYRSYNDLDFLIAEEDLPKAIDLLVQRGYEASFYDFPTDSCKKKLLFRHMNEIFLYHPKMETGVELHWKLFSADFKDDTLLNEIIKSNQQVLEMNGKKFQVFTIEFELLYLIIHGGLHAWNKLKWLVDIHEILKRFPVDPQKFLKLTKELDAHRLVSTCNELLKIYYPNSAHLPSDSIAPKQMVEFAQYEINRDQEKSKQTIKDFFLVFFNGLQAFPGWRYKSGVIKNLLFATDLAAVTWLPCSPWVYYLISPFWKLWRGFR